MKSIKHTSPKNNEVIVAFLDLIQTGLDRGYTLQEFHDFIARENKPYCGMCELEFPCDKHK